jgi:hypothetical protein
VNARQFDHGHPASKWQIEVAGAAAPTTTQEERMAKSLLYIMASDLRVRPAKNINEWRSHFADRFQVKTVITKRNEVRKWKLIRRKTDTVVSTVFLGINHQFGNGPPLLFETMIFGGQHDGYQQRCSTLEQAKQQHKRAVLVALGKEES